MSLLTCHSRNVTLNMSLLTCHSWHVCIICVEILRDFEILNFFVTHSLTLMRPRGAFAPKNAWDMPEICPRIAWDKTEIGLQYAWDMLDNMHDICLRLPLEMNKMYQRYIWYFLEICLRYAWYMSEIFSGYSWDFYEICLRYIWDWHFECSTQFWSIFNPFE